MITWTGRRTGDVGVSESIGFLLIFTMVIVGIGLVTLYGYPMLLQQQTSADKQIMLKNMIVLQNDMKSLAYKTVPFKETSLNIGSGSLTAYDFMTNGPTFTITDSVGTVFLQTKTGDLRYYSAAAGGEISLQNGAVVNRNLVELGSSMLSQPRWFYDSQTGTMVVNLIRINTTERTISRTGIGDLQMELGEPYFASYTASAGQIHNPVSIAYTADAGQDYGTAWDNYFNLGPLGPAPPSPVVGLTRTYQLPMTVSTLVIKRTDVIIKSL